MSQITEPKNVEDVVGKPVGTTNINFAATGLTGLNRYSNFVYEDFLPQLHWPKAAKIYQEMADNDATVGAIFYLAKQLVRKSGWTVEPASESPEDIAAAKFVEECMNDMTESWQDFISEVLSMFVYGWSFHEVVYKVRRGPMEKNPKYRSKYSDGKIGWRSMPGRSQHTLYGWDFAEDGHAVGMIQWAPPKFEMTHIPFTKGVLFRTQVERGNPEGRSLLRSAYRSWYFKKRIEEIEGIGIERDLAGLPVLIPPETVNIWDALDEQATTIRNTAESIVRNIRRDKAEGVVIPYGWELKLLSTGGTRQFDTNAIINRYDQRIAITMLSDIVMLGADKVGSFALADVKKSLMATAIEAQVMGIVDVLNKYCIPPLMQINAMKCPNGYPKFKCAEIETPSLEDVAKVLKATGVDVHTNRNIYNAIMDYINAPQLSEEEFERLQQSRKEMQEDKNTSNPDEVDPSGQKIRDPKYDKDGTDSSLDL